MKYVPLAVAFAVAVLCVPGGPAWSQELIRIDPRYYCAAEPGRIPEQLTGFPPTRAAERAVEEIVDLVGLGTGGWSLWSSSEDKASASRDPVSGARRIVYNEDFIRNLRGESRSVWANVAILAHEVAHHLNNHLDTGDRDTRHFEELQADRFAGYVLYHRGASEEATRRVFRALGGGGDYPPVRDRVTAARNGWLRARELGRELGPGRADLDAVNEDAGTNRADDDFPPAPRVSGLSFRVEHTPTVFHAGGGAPGAGFRFRLLGRLDYNRDADLRVVISFWFADGRMLFANPQEANYRAGNGQVVTGMRRFRFRGGTLDLGSLSVDPLPYYAFNLGPPLNATYNLVGRASVYVDDSLVATSGPVPLFVVW